MKTPVYTVTPEQLEEMRELSSLQVSADKALRIAIDRHTTNTAEWDKKSRLWWNEVSEEGGFESGDGNHHVNLNTGEIFEREREE